ncbi:hypothetical protein BUALT_Bualt13G0060800 [Buddleja alternifolia]|uniref:Fatty acyl-CoA reductase n=1 Tax=Buddleja alternifolia TaxID=168488 RepID=A0AAV6WJA7_9LAMI|nr:hypothetical protein BUALT_Bualt13G0060800 [Buddleja alternifolia]
MEVDKIVQHFEGKTIFITGATGFLAKVLVEKILRVQPNVKKLFLLIRASNVRSSEQRFHKEVVDTELFQVLRNKWGENLTSFLSSKVVPISGDVCHENLGIINTELRDAMWKDIDFIVNSAATTRFDERYDVAMDINTFGALHVLNFAKNCSKLKLLLHVSTAFVHGTSPGLILEKQFQMGETLEGAKVSYLDINGEKKLVEERKTKLQAQNMTEKELTSTLKDLGVERAVLHGWPNTYSYTKAMGEMLLEKFKENINIVIMRPTIITSTWREPFPGWMEGLRTLDSIFVGLGKGKLKVFLGDPNTTLDMIPGDMVVNSMLVAMAIRSHQSSDEIIIYNIGSSLRNPIKYDNVRCLIYQYLKRNPLVNDTGKPIKMAKVKILSSMSSFHRYIEIRYLPILKVKFVSILSSLLLSILIKVTNYMCN